jgi:hypothetical protein
MKVDKQSQFIFHGKIWAMVCDGLGSGLKAFHLEIKIHQLHASAFWIHKSILMCTFSLNPTLLLVYLFIAIACH